MNLRAGSLDDWYVVDGCFGQPEGTPEEWGKVISLIKEGRSGSGGRRVGVDMQDDGAAHLFSPRNQTSERDYVRIPAENLGQWIEDAEALLELAVPTPAANLPIAASQRLVRLGSTYTQVQMSEEEREKAIQSAHWVTASPHEWEWSTEEQARMALFVMWASQRLEMIGVLASGAPVTHEGVAP